jgi:acyl-CoA reductase-like NAD-dependent aldehyde dehydrogenase
MGRRQKWRQNRRNQSVSSSSWITGIVDHFFSFIADPATNEELGTVPEMGLAETKEAIEAAHKAFPAWSRTTAKVSMLLPCTPHVIYRLQYRHDVLIKFFNLMQQHSDDLGRLIVRSTSS